MGGAEPSPQSRMGAIALWGALGVCAAILGFAVLSRFAAYYVWDDGFMFVRYAGNVLMHGRVSWNPGGEPTYGLTSLFYLPVVIVFRLLLPALPGLVIALSSLACAAAFLVLLARLVWRVGPTEAPARLLVFVFVAVVVARAARPVAAHSVGGMDTAFALAWLTAYLLLVERCQRVGSAASGIALGVWGGLSYFARPDLLVYACAAPAAVAVLGPTRSARRRAVAALAITAGLVAVQMLLAQLYFGSALPLPFYAKSLDLYGEAATRVFGDIPSRELGHLAAWYWPFLAVIAVDVLTGARQFVRRTSAAEWGLVLATALFVAYYRFFVLQIMPHGQRFYYPVVPGLVYLATRSAGRLLSALPRRTVERLRRRRGVACLVGALAGAWLLAPAVGWLHSAWASGLAGSHVGRFALRRIAERPRRPVWPGLVQFSDLPDDLVVATTEVGLPSVMNPRRTIADLSGLHDTDMAHHGFSADAFFARCPHDLIYLPEPHYARIRGAILSHPVFQRDYEVYSARMLGAEVGLALRRDSRHYPAMRTIAEGLLHGNRP